MSSAFVPLHVKSHFSIGVGTASIPALVQHAGRLGYAALALTDIENLYGQVQFHARCRAAGIQPISGVELRPAFSAGKSPGEEQGRVVLLASNAAAYASVCQIVTKRRTGSAQTRAPAEALEHLQPGVFVLTRDPETLRALVRALGPDWVRALVLRPHPHHSASASAERALLATAKELGVKPLADIDTSVLDERQHALQRLVQAVHLRRNVSDDDVGEAAEGRPLLTPHGAEQLFMDLPEALAESRSIAEACELTLGASNERALADRSGDEAPCTWRSQSSCRFIKERACIRQGANDGRSLPPQELTRTTSTPRH